MKKSITIAFLMLSFAGFSQQLTYGSGGTVYNEDHLKLSPNLVRQFLVNDKEALKLYDAGRSKKTWGNVFFYGGLGLIVTNVAMGLNEDIGDTKTSSNGYVTSVESKQTSFTAGIIGGALLIASIPIKVGYPKKIKAALAKHNSSVASNERFVPKTTLLASVNQIGVRIEF
jgi:hypothetical protein